MRKNTRVDMEIFIWLTETLILNPAKWILKQLKKVFMKRTFLVICLLTAITCQAQVKSYLQDSKQVKLLQDSIEIVLPQFKFNSVDSGTDLSGKMYAIILTNSKGETVTIQYRNEDNGDVSIYGSYDELYALWKKYFNANADKKRVAFTGDRIRNNGSFIFVKQNDTWRIFHQ